MKTETADPQKPKSQHVEDAVRAALEGRWEEAFEINRLILDRFGPEEEAQNRLGKALTELGRYDEAKAAYEATLALNPLNIIAQKNRAKLDVLSQNRVVKMGPTRVDLNLFVEEQGKTTATSLEDVADKDVHNKVAAGDIAELRVEGDTIVAETVRGVRLGMIESRLARRLIKFINGGNRYLAAITSVEPGSVKLLIRETYQDPQFDGKPSFPMRRKKETEFRAYTRGSLVLSRGLDVEDLELDADEVVDEEAEDGEGLDGLNVVDEDDAAFVDDAGDDDEDEDEDE